MNDQKAIILGRISILLLGVLWLVKSVFELEPLVYGSGGNIYLGRTRLIASATTVTWILLVVAISLPYFIIWNNDQFQTSVIYIIFGCLLFSSISTRQLTILFQSFGIINIQAIKWYNVLLQLLPVEILVLVLIQPVKIPAQKIKRAEIIIALGLLAAQIITIIAAPQVEQSSATRSLGLSTLVELQMSLLYFPLIYLNLKVLEHLKHAKNDTQHESRPISQDNPDRIAS